MIFRTLILFRVILRLLFSTFMISYNPVSSIKYAGWYNIEDRLVKKM